ncbi:MAG: hypothetical protein AAGL69_17165 [Pseudomonadota bacterium]
MIDSLLLHADIAFFALLAAFYCIDCGALLHPNDIMLVGSGRQAFAAITPMDGFLFNRKHAVFPGLLQPSRLIVSLSWPSSDHRPDKATADWVDQLTEAMRLLTPLRVGGNVLLVMMFVMLPASYIVAGESLWLIAVVLATYAIVVAMVFSLLFLRRRLELRWGQVLVLAFESLVCPPIAINLYRKTLLASRRSHSTDLLGVCRALLGDSRYTRLLHSLRELAEWPTARTDSPNFAQWRARLDESFEIER